MAPTPVQKKKMVSLALKGFILASLKNHMFSFNNKIYLQTSGGAIGDRLVGVLADILGSYWSRNFLDKLEDSNITPEIKKLYVDDKTIVMKPVPLGARYNDGRVEVIEEEIENDRSIPADLRTARVLKDVGNRLNTASTKNLFPSENPS